MDEDDDRRPFFHWGDFGALALASGFSLFGLYLIVDMLFGGHPLAILFQEPPKQAAAAPSEAEWRSAPFHAEKGEVVLSTNAPLQIAMLGDTFPAIKDRVSLRITLARTMCFGTCPAYSVEIASDGAVLYRGQDCVVQKGEQRARIAAAAVDALVQKFRDTRYFSLRDAYRADITDNPTTTTSIAFDGKTKTVSDYAGGAAGMPKEVSDLEDAIDKAAGTERWVYDGTRTCNGNPVDDSWRKAKH